MFAVTTEIKHVEVCETQSKETWIINKLCDLQDMEDKDKPSLTHICDSIKVIAGKINERKSNVRIR